MEPLQNDTADQAPDTAPDFSGDPGVQEAAGTLERAIETTSGGGRQAAERETRQEAAPPPAQAPSIRPARNESYRQYQARQQQGFRQRIQAERQRRQDLEEYRRQTQGTVEKQAELNKMMLEYLRGRQPEGPPPPDALDPKFPEWLRAQMTAQNQEALKPVLEFFRQQKEQQERDLQQREQQAQQATLAEHITQTYQGHQAEYEQVAPELAYGFHHRFETMRGVMSGAFEDMGYPREQAAQMADVHLLTIGDHARARGENPVAAIDEFQKALARRFGFDPVEPGDDIEGVWAEGPGDGNGYHQPAPLTETERLASVQRRARPAGNVAPRVASRAEQQRSELADLVRGGVTDRKALMAAALRDSGGNMREAGLALARAAAGA